MKKLLLVSIFGVGCICGLLLATMLKEKPTTSGDLSAGNSIDSLITVTVRGTEVDVFPQDVDVIVDNPEDAVRQALKLGATKPVKDALMVVYMGVNYQFFKPDAWNQRSSNIKLKDGDVIYYFHLESAKDVSGFVRRYGLTKEVGFMARGNGSKTSLFETTRGFYVCALTATTMYHCSVCETFDANATTKKQTPGPCSKCGLPLMEIKVHR